MIKFLALSLMIVLISAHMPGNINVINLDNGWTLKYSFDGAYLFLAAKGTNKGALTIGLGGQEMDGVDVAHLWYDNGIKVADRSYINPTADVNGNKQVLLDTERTPAGTDDFVNVESDYDPETGVWSVIIKRKLKTDDQYDNEIKDGESVQLSIAVFDSMTWGQMHSQHPGHQFVKLSSEKIGDVAAEGDMDDDDHDDTQNSNSANTDTDQNQNSASLLLFEAFASLLLILAFF